MSQIRRRELLKNATVAAVGGAAGLAACQAPAGPAGGAPAVQSKTYEWTFVTTWPTTLPIFMDGVRMIAEQIETMSQGRMKIRVYGGGELVPPLEAFDAVSSGTAQMGHGAAYYWAGKAPAAQFFAAIPFGLNAQQMHAWFYGGGGLELWTEVYDEFGLTPFPAGNTGVQMGGWFQKEINSIADFDGLKMRIPGLGGKVISELGGSAVLLAGGEIYTSLERGVIDATEWVGPYHDEIMGFHNVAKNYYYPGWHEPGTVLELFVNKSEYEALPPDLRQIIRTAADAQNTWMLSQFEARNNAALRKLVDEHKVQLRPFPTDVMAGLKKTATQVIDGVAASDAMSAKVYDSFRKFRENVAAWGRLSEQPFYNAIQNI
jgi:TRAP-type mannitol/chloroaromatic compound transport system substrate-binding protein